MTSEHILIVEDDENIQQLVGYNLVKAGFSVSYAETGAQAVERVAAGPPDLILLDLMLPELSGVEVCRVVRSDAATREIPIIMLTAKGEEGDIVAGLDMGADDYITKPFSPKVLVARVKALLRRRQGDAPEAPAGKPGVLKVHDFVIDPGKHEVLVSNKPVSLTLTEFAILELLAKHPGWVFSRQQIIDTVRGYDYVITPRAVDVQVFGLRKKLGHAGEYIETVRGVGYKIKE